VISIKRLKKIRDTHYPAGNSNIEAEVSFITHLPIGGQIDDFK